jgi:hypothetical protein
MKMSMYHTARRRKVGRETLKLRARIGYTLITWSPKPSDYFLLFVMHKEAFHQ